jgi:hypothetical protein
MVISHFRVGIVKDNTIGYYLSKMVPGGIYWPSGPTVKLFLAGEKKHYRTMLGQVMLNEKVQRDVL